jgi:hypothetical protein
VSSRPLVLEPGYLAVVTETRAMAEVTESAGHIWAALARRYAPWLVLLEHHLAPEAGEGGETLDLVSVGRGGAEALTCEETRLSETPTTCCLTESGPCGR